MRMTIKWLLVKRAEASQVQELADIWDRSIRVRETHCTEDIVRTRATQSHD